MSITATKPPACKFCEYWEEEVKDRFGHCHASYGRRDPDKIPSGFMALDNANAPAALVTGPEFNCCHFKDKKS